MAGHIRRVALLLPALAAAALGQYCDASLRQDPAYPLGYRLRGDRCEGVYIRDVANSLIQIASFTSHFDDFNPTSTDSLQLHWETPKPAAVFLRALDLKQRLYYRMDTERPAGTTSFRWATELVSALRLTRRDLGLLAWQVEKIGGEPRPVYLPVRAGNSGGAVSGYELVLLPGRDLKEVYLTLAPVQAGGTFGKPLAEARRVLSGYLPAGRPLRITLSEMEAPGLYYVELGAPLQAGGSATVEMWFYHVGGFARGARP